MSAYYIDCEFDGHNGPLLSLAIVRDDAFGLHIRTFENAQDVWVIANVMPLMDCHKAQQSQWIPLNEVGPSIKAFIGADQLPTIVADSPVDIGRFCAVISTGSTGEWSSCGYPEITFKVINVDCYPTELPGAVQHNAWWDAMALRHIVKGAKQ